MRHLYFISVLKQKADLALFKTRISVQSLTFNPVGWQKWYGNRVIARSRKFQKVNLNVSLETENGYLF